jgi:hypothetical protein
MNFFPPYYNIDDAINNVNSGKDIILFDHIGGFDQTYSNTILQQFNKQCVDSRATIWYVQILDHNVKSKYKNINLKFRFNEQYDVVWKPFENYNIHPTINFKNFVCCFNGTPHVSRKLLASILHRFQWFIPMYCSKNFSYSIDTLDGHITDYVSEYNNFYRKFFIEKHSEDFFQSIVSFGHVQFKHDKNIYNLEHKLTESFLHIVSETMATSYYPFVTEKFLYSIVTRGLFLAYAQPGWHAHVEKYYGFRPYTRLFDYRFDSIQNPVERLVELMSMIAKFSVLSTDDWRDLYELEKDTIEHNYNHYFSGDYLNTLKTYV